MADVWVSREHLHAGDLPPVCVVSGQPPDARVPFRSSSLPEWTWVLLLFGVFPFLIAAYFAEEEVVGEVPVVAAVVERYHRLRRWSVGLAGAALVGLVVAAATPTRWLAWSSGLLLIGGVAVAVTASRGFIDGRPDRTGLWVKLTRVHPNFVQQLQSRGQTIGPPAG